MSAAIDATIGSEREEVVYVLGPRGWVLASDDDRRVASSDALDETAQLLANAIADAWVGVARRAAHSVDGGAS